MAHNALTVSTRRPALTAIRGLSLTIGIVAITVAVVYAIVSLPVGSMWVPSGDGSGAGSFADLPFALRVVRVAAMAITCVTVAVICFLLAGIARHVREEVRFVPVLSRTTMALAIALAVGSTLAQILANIGRWSGVVYPDDPEAMGADLGSLPIRWSAINLQTLAPNWGMLGISIVLGVLALIIRSGERLQRETEGLV